MLQVAIAIADSSFDSRLSTMAAQSSIHLHFYSRRLTVSACHLLLCAATYAKSSSRQGGGVAGGWSRSRSGRRRRRQPHPPRTFAKLLQCRKFLSHVYKKFNACTFHILCSVAQWDECHDLWQVCAVKTQHKIEQSFALLCPLAPLCVAALDSATHRLFGSSQLAHICLSICRAVLPGQAASLPGSCCMWQQREAAASVQCAIDLRLFDCIRTRTLAATDADSCGCTLRLKLHAAVRPPPPALVILLFRLWTG